MPLSPRFCRKKSVVGLSHGKLSRRLHIYKVLGLSETVVSNLLCPDHLPGGSGFLFVVAIVVSVG